MGITLEQLKKKALESSYLTRQESVNNWINLVESEFELSFRKKKIGVILIHARKHGGPTTIIKLSNALVDMGHEVTLYCIYSNDINPAVIEDSRAKFNVDWENIEPCDILISNSDNPYNHVFVALPQVKKKVMFKLSHNPRFKQLEEASLNLKWDAILTSTQWLADVCKHPTEGWNYPPQRAIRIGWNHYGHSLFDCSPRTRRYTTPGTIGFLAHHHPLKGTKDAVKALEIAKGKYPDLNIIAVGEWADFKQIKPPWVNYIYNPTRQQLADYMKKFDMWVSASHSEGLGRMALESMSAGVVPIVSETGAEFASDRVNCLTFPIGDHLSLFHKIEELINDKELFIKLALGAYETATVLADPEPFKDNLRKIIERIA